MAEDITQDVRHNLLVARERLARQLGALDRALMELGETDFDPIPTTAAQDSLMRTRLSVGDDKLEAVRKYIKGRGKVRQVDIVKATKLNSGTVSTALHAMSLAGEVEPGPKENRSRTWVVKK